MRQTLVVLVLGVLGVSRMVADLAGLPVAGALAATGVAPAPKVFSSVDGLETYSSRFFVEWVEPSGALRSVAVTPARYQGLDGPYNRRNVYGAAIAYGPVLAADPRTRPLFDSVQHAALCGSAPLLAELGIDASEREGPLWVRVEPERRPIGARWQTRLAVECS